MALLQLDPCGSDYSQGSNSFVRFAGQYPHSGARSCRRICHLYVDKAADIDKAVEIAVDAKTQYPAACNAIETLLVHQSIASAFLPRLL